MKRVGILTFHTANNYGAVLQCYALRSTFNKYADCDVINYINSNIENRASAKRFFLLHKNFIGFIMWGLNARAFNKRQRIFDEFREKKLKVNFSGKLFLTEDMQKLNSEYDLFVVGSDQVWNLNLTDNDITYFLDFVCDDSKKYSYAASVGNEEVINSKTDCLELLKKFQQISIREKSTVDWMKRKGILNITQNIDPVFLLDSNMWIEIAEDFIYKRKYLLFFVNGKPNKLTYNLVVKISKEKKLKILYMANEDRFYRFPLIKHMVGISPEKFLGVIKNASFIVTDSFHVTAFSIIFHKEFIYDDRGFYNNRVIDLTNQLRLEGRCITNYCNNDDLDATTWEQVDLRIKSQRQIGHCYLKDITVGNL
ncbi:MAG: polysaccharide pyruvyl transferase family protein [Lachnospiraceae bacterium]|nr:polysaccharide pyruvyl transferase family protein [Lachnospiraceae bacterium]